MFGFYHFFCFNINFIAGKSYDVVSYKPQGPEATVILSSALETKIGIFFSNYFSIDIVIYDTLLSEICNDIML